MTTTETKKRESTKMKSGSGYNGTLNSRESLLVKTLGGKAMSVGELFNAIFAQKGRKLTKVSDVSGMVKKAVESGVLKRYWTPDGVPRYFAAK